MAEAKAQSRYKVVERIASGGMAEVFRGELESLAGAKKTVAIKRVLPQLAKNDAFIGMFLDEARLSVRLNHRNIVSVFDVGQFEDTFFIVMEFIDGVDLKSVIKHFRDRNVKFPLRSAVQVAIEMCNGLQYAHELKGDDGKALGIVHRDISPANVLVSTNGEIKIVDFGLAKAAMHHQKTLEGVIKGKFGYLAPETAMGKEADQQADIFAVGIVLWEMLAGRQLFKGDNEYETVKLVQAANIPALRPLNSEVSTDLEAIIRKALAKEKAVRYKSAREFANALSQFLAFAQLAVTQEDISALVKEARNEKGSPSSNSQVFTAQSIVSSILTNFTLEDDKPKAPTAALVVQEAKPEGGGSLENPADWFGDDDGGDFGEPKPPAAKDEPEPQSAGDDLSPPVPPPAQAEPAAETRAPADTSGSVDVDTSAKDEPPAPPPAPERPAPPVVATPTATSPREVSATSDARNSIAPPTKNASLVMAVMLAVVVLGVAAVLYFAFAK